MGEYADLEIEREQDVEGRRLMHEHEKQSRADRLAAAVAALEETAQALAGLDFVIARVSEFHFHIKRGRKVAAQWWPSTGSTMLGNSKGPRCNTGPQLVRWLKRVEKRAAARSLPGADPNTT